MSKRIIGYKADRIIFDEAEEIHDNEKILSPFGPIINEEVEDGKDE